MTLTAGYPSSAGHRHDHEPTGTSWPAPPPGWYPDPTGHAPLRQWDGRAWSEWVSDGVSVSRDPGAIHRRLDAADLPHLDFIQHVFLPDALAKGCVTPEEEAELEHLLGTLRAQATGGAATTTPGRITPTPEATGLVGGSFTTARPIVTPVVTPAASPEPTSAPAPAPAARHRSTRHPHRS